jgi:hypothetical protein
MTDTSRRVDYFYAIVPDSPGEGARILSALKREGVDLLAYLGFPTGSGEAQIDLVPTDSNSLRQAADRIGLALTGAKHAFLIQGDDRVGSVEATTAKLSTAGVNITAAAAASDGSGHYGMILWVAEADYEQAAQILGA